MHQKTHNCQNCKKDFVIESDDFDFYEKMKVPAPTFCPECRYQRRLTNRNEWIFYTRACDLCKKKMVTIHNPEYKGRVYCQPCFWSDQWDAFNFGAEFDFSRPFFEQFNELRLRTPRISMANEHSVNSEYTNQSEHNKNCYLCVSSGNSENCLYGYWNYHSRDCVDSYAAERCERGYEFVNCTKCSRGAYLENCADCTDSYFLKDCRGCINCFGSYGLRSKSYYWLNKQLTVEEYKKRFKEFIFSNNNIQNLILKLKEIELTKPHKYYHGQKVLISAGDYLEEAKYARDAFNCRHVENIKHCQDTWFAKDVCDATEAYGELSFEIEGTIAIRSAFIAKMLNISDSYYLDLCGEAHNLFGCVGLQKKQYCILNRQYTKEEYNELLPKIIEHMKKTGEWGQFFPTSISSFAYNETVAQDYFPLTRGEALERGYQWYDRKDREYKIDFTPDKLPKTIKEVDDSVLDKIILCTTQLSEDYKKKYYNCTTAFKITKAELDFYRNMGLPLPEKCFHDRRQDRMALRNPRKLWHRQCMCDKKHSNHVGKCTNEFETSYAPDRPEIVYCETCYNQEIV
ncbi:MAG: hypothetical protein NT155_00640 [Candidatus Staskawiczbacteria bacterium]|nr:hypothetical protein [Candidatus Staskawiczbacteria bacterium]